MELSEFDRAAPAQAAAVLRPCADVDSFVDALVDGRPYGRREHLLDAARAQAAGWTPEEVEKALAAHPRIGERPHAADASAEMSRSEQGAVDAQDSELQRWLAAGNRAYEERFGRVFLVRAAGRSGEEILALLEERLTHDDATELRVVTQQLAEIALLRLAGAVT